MWITDAKEIENYLPASVLRKLFEDDSLSAPGQWQRFFPAEKGNAANYIEESLGRKISDKVDLATRASREMSLENVKERFDWPLATSRVVAKIAEWNQ